MRRSPAVPALLGGVLACSGCASNWSAYRHQGERTAQQPRGGALSDPSKVPGLHQVWVFNPSSVGDVETDGFVASPTVHDGKLFVGHRNGRFYALDASTGALIWRYPAPGQPLLLQ